MLFATAHSFTRLSEALRGSIIQIHATHNLYYAYILRLYIISHLKPYYCELFSAKGRHLPHARDADG